MRDEGEERTVVGGGEREGERGRGRVGVGEREGESGRERERGRGRWRRGVNVGKEGNMSTGESKHICETPTAPLL